MEKSIIINIWCFICLLAVFSACSEKAITQRRVKIYLNNCGFIPDHDQMYNATRNELLVYDLKPKETIAEIGTGTGWLTGLILLHYDSLQYFASDIDRYALAALKPVTDKYCSLRTTPQNNTLTIIESGCRNTNLPDRIFDKVIVRETFHHFEQQDEMLESIKKTIKTGGRIFVYEPNVESSYYSRDCRTRILSCGELREIFNRHGLVILKEHELVDSPGNVPSWYKKDPSKIKPHKIFELVPGD